MVVLAITSRSRGRHAALQLLKPVLDDGELRDRGLRVRAASEVGAFTEAQPSVTRIADILRG